MRGISLQPQQPMEHKQNAKRKVETICRFRAAELNEFGFPTSKRGQTEAEHEFINEISVGVCFLKTAKSNRKTANALLSLMTVVNRNETKQGGTVHNRWSDLFL